MFFFKSSSNKISPQDAKALIEAKEAILIDVREVDEFREARIAGAINVPLATLEREIHKHSPDKESQIIVYCLSGGRSARAADILKKLGYSKVSDLGGIMSWPYAKER